MLPYCHALRDEKSHTESELETAIIDSLQKFLMELGKGYVFVARQQHIRADLDDFYIDLVSLVGFHV